MTTHLYAKTWLLLLLFFGFLAPTTGFANNTSQLVELNFKRTQQGNAHLLLHFSNQATLPKAETTAQGLRLKFNAITVADHLNLYDASDFSTPVSDFEFFQLGAQAELVIKIEGAFSYLLNTQNKQLSIEITAKPTLNPKAAKQESNDPMLNYTGELISLSYHDIPLRHLLAELAAFLNLNLITDDSISGNATLHLEGIPSDQALDLLLISQGLASRQQGKVLFVAPANKLIELEAQQQRAQQAAFNLSPLEDAFIKINYADAKAIQAFILGDQKTLQSAKYEQPTAASNGLGNLLKNLPLTLTEPTQETEHTLKITRQFLSNRGHLLVDERTNTLYVRDTPEQVRRIKTIVEILDVAVEQVMIEARIVVARAGVTDELGVSWGIKSSHLATDSSFTTANQAKANNTGLLKGSHTSSLDFSPKAGASFGFVSNKLLLDLELKVLETENRSEVISQPKVITSNRNKAVIRSGEEIPYQSTPNKDGVTTTSFRNAELRLEVTPQIVGNGRIFLSLKVNNDSRGDATEDAGPAINTNAVETQVLVNNGETIVIGGIFTSQKSNYQAKVPFLGDLPLVGWLFRNSISKQEKVELLVFITPRMINDTLVKK